MDSYRIFQEALSSIRQNKARSALSGFGVAWGIFILTVLLGVGDGIGLYITPAEMGGYKTRYQVPIFAEIKYSFLDWIVSPFVDLKAGGFYDYTLGGTGYVIRPSVGVDIWRFSISAGWDHNRFRWDIGRFGNPGWHIGVSYNF